MRILLVGFLMLIGAYLMFELTLSSGATIEVARTSAVNAVVAMQIGYLFNCRSLVHSWWSIGWLSNRILLVGIAIMIGLQLLFTFVPFMQVIFQTGPMGLQGWLGVAALGVATSLIVGVEKWIRARLRA